jgi:hypothetical protein
MGRGEMGYCFMSMSPICVDLCFEKVFRLLCFSFLAHFGGHLFFDSPPMKRICCFFAAAAVEEDHLSL